jgi:hypothetical protein
MTRAEAIEEQEKLFGKDATLFTICTDLRHAVNGAADPWPEESLDKAAKLLEARLATWTKGLAASQDADRAVRKFVRATLEEVGRARGKGLLKEKWTTRCEKEETVCFMGGVTSIRASHCTRVYVGEGGMDGAMFKWNLVQSIALLPVFKKVVRNMAKGINERETCVAILRELGEKE